MAIIRAEFSEEWTDPSGTPAGEVSTSFRLVQTDTIGQVYSLEKGTTDAAGGTSWVEVTTFDETSNNTGTVASLAQAKLSPNVFAALFGILLNIRRANA